MTENIYHFTRINMLADWNGEISPLEELRIPAMDRGFLFGDAVYEVLRVHQGECLWLESHMERLERSLTSVRMNTNLAVIQNRMMRLLNLTQRKQGIMYVQVTRGVGPRRHQFPAPGTPSNILIFLQDFDQKAYEIKRQRGAKGITLLDQRWKHPDIKSINLLPNCLAIQEACDAGCDEVILYNERDELIESPNANLFCVIDNKLVTPPLGTHLLHGITRKILMQCARQLQMEVIERFPMRSEIPKMSELFLTSTTCEVMPVVNVDGQKIGNGESGEIGRRLLREFRHTADGYRFASPVAA